MQNVSFIHLLIFKIQSILEYRDEAGLTHFLPWPPKQTFSQLLTCVNLYHNATITATVAGPATTL